MEKKLSKSTNRRFFGVCGGIAEYLDIDPTIIRLCFVLSTFCCGFGLVPYILCAIIMPDAE